ncbi:WxcM domain-containing protein [Fibrella aestuarina BUZ 2]|uniref:WxcM domain-containing protein n=1 Tax=Fibrella aestuarina BUZ 2 TaxID=1166018 RepID=I0K8F9_9BACT|nr:FdtA/QdtA family cupin domain-containing protein [Fibrella aestuarina]CCH00412.1 WxcM domain-containing protein [Fibrella aestuarina BUZ 2]
MAHLLTLTQHSCERGDLTVLERVLPGTLKRVFYITNADGAVRGGHRHKKAWLALTCLQGSVDVLVDNGQQATGFTLDKPDQCLVLEPEDWHLLTAFRNTAIVLVVSNEGYDAADYIDQKPGSTHNERASASVVYFC